MTKRIKHVSELPNWFNLAKYEFTKNLDALGWFKQLVIRGLHFIKAEKINGEVLIEPAHAETLKIIIPIIHKNPHLLIDDSTAHSLRASIQQDHNSKKLEQSLGVYPVQIKYASTKTPLGVYQVNYNFSDDFLIENFKHCLAVARKKYKSCYRPPYQKSDFKHWVKLGVLPYIDLLMWSVEAKKHITHRVLANALYPYGDKGEETIRKTTTPLVEEILSPYSMVQLHAQAYISTIEENFC